MSDEASVHALAEHVYRTHGRCNLLFLNAGVTSGGGGLPWQQEPNDWRWCFGVNVFGVGIGVAEFVPRMIAGASRPRSWSPPSATAASPRSPPRRSMPRPRPR